MERCYTGQNNVRLCRTKNEFLKFCNYSPSGCCKLKYISWKIDTNSAEFKLLTCAMT